MKKHIIIIALLVMGMLLIGCNEQDSVVESDGSIANENLPPPPPPLPGGDPEDILQPEDAVQTG